MGRIFVAAGVAVSHGHADPGLKWNPTVRSMDLGSVRSSLCALGSPRFGSSAPGSERGSVPANGKAEERRRQADESLRTVMYVSCWGQN
uniref:Uncharacterized protein n=1 Tax=Nymphaea colorata TaxID=210225 RepID=A0A5K0XLX3_9MAGN